MPRPTSSEVSVSARGLITVRPEPREDAPARYRVEHLADGTIILTPVVHVTPAELRAMGTPAGQAALAQDQGPGVVSGTVDLP
jgi:hypothetical protein